MTTRIFDPDFDFFNREDKSVNGVSREFAATYPDYEQQNATNDGCWNCSGCSDCSRCSDCADCTSCSGCSECSDCLDCSNCIDCCDCSDCSSCSEAAGGSNYCRFFGYETDESGGFTVPVLENIHQQIWAAVSTPGALRMSYWHTSETTHSRAGWVVTLAGEAGKALEAQTSTLFAAQQIYKASSPTIAVSPTQFYKSDERAMEDMKRCAALEAQANQSVN